MVLPKNEIVLSLREQQTRGQKQNGEILMTFPEFLIHIQSETGLSGLALSAALGVRPARLSTWRNGRQQLGAARMASIVAKLRALHTCAECESFAAPNADHATSARISAAIQRLRLAGSTTLRERSDAEAVAAMVSGATVREYAASRGGRWRVMVG